MPDWLSPILEWTLLILKVTGLIGAFAGFSVEASHANEQSAPGAAHGDKHAGTTRKKSRIVAIIFLGVAIGAEFCDSLLKRFDSREQAERFERLAHPLGPITVTPLYSLTIEGRGFEAFRQRLDASDGELVTPDKKNEALAYALYTATPDIYIFIYRPDGPNLLNTDREPDISFDTNLVRRVPVTDSIATDRHYSYDAGRIHGQLPPSTNSSDDRYANGSIISVHDLLGSELVIRLCLLADSSLDIPSQLLLARHFTLDTLYIAFPGRQEFTISPQAQKLKSVAPEGNNPCWYYHYNFPKTKKEWDKARIP